MKIVCAWCEEKMAGEDDDPEVSHGICKSCEEKFEEERREIQGE